MLSIEEIQQQAVVLYKSLEKLSAAERKQHPSAHFGERYNQLLSQAKTVLNDQVAENWPPQLQVAPPNHIGPKITYATYVEIEIYSKQISSRLSQNIDPGYGFVVG